MDPDRFERLNRPPDRAERWLRTSLGAVAVLVFIGVVYVLFDMNGPTYGGRIYLAIAAIVFLGWIDEQYRRLEDRRLVWPGGPGERAYWWRMRLSLGLLIVAAVILLTIAVTLG